VKKTRQNKRLEPGSDSIRTDKALGDPFGQYEIAGRHQKPVLVARLSVYLNAQCAGALETAAVFRAAGGSVGSAVAPALSTTAVVIMLTPWRSTSLFGMNSMKNKVAELTTAVTTAIVTGTKSLLRGRMACLSV
jgi:hypothetical protein